MQGGTRIAIGVGIGYVLGRTRKMRFALGLAGAAMARRSSGTKGDLLELGTSLVKSSPELTQLTDTVRGELLGAIRSAAVAAASNRIDALNHRLQQGTTLVADEDRDESEETESDEDDYDEQLRDDERGSAEEDEEFDDEDEEEAGRPAAKRRPARRSGTSTAGKSGSRTSARRAGPADRTSSSAARRRSRADADEAPVRRTRR
ncbi:hypothetical protein [Nocardia noduli]|uniref:hypothetical protein n=1 Tax=Nocardia noduli TaxID=2815722 RepID=UPI001C244AB0|nr:hypothetical protein [Nocardia noduli]